MPSYPVRQTMMDEIPGTQEGTTMNNAWLQSVQKRLENYAIFELAQFFKSWGYLVAPIIEKPSTRRLTLKYNSGSITKYIDSVLGMWEISQDLSIDLAAIGSGVNRYDYLYLELYRSINTGQIGYRLNIYHGNSSPSVQTTPDVTTSTRNSQTEENHNIFPLRAVHRVYPETDIDTGTDISVAANATLGAVADLVLAGTLNNSFQIGSGGVILKNNSQGLDVRNSGDTAYTDFNCANIFSHGNINSDGTVLTLNQDYAGSSPGDNCTIEIERGTVTNASILWDESSDTWKAGLKGSETAISLSGHTHTSSSISDFQSSVSSNTDVTANTAARHSHSNKTLLDTYTQSETNLADAVSKKHTQGTDTGTTSTYFIIGSGGPRIKNNSGAIELRNNGDTSYIDLVINNLTVKGTTTTVESETILLNDNIIVLNNNYSGSSPTENGGFEVERGTLTNASLIFDESSDTWKAGLKGSETAISLSGHTHTSSSISDFQSSVSSNTDVAANTAARHTQGTDTGTTSSTFILGSSGPKLKNNGGVVEIKNNADSDYANMKANQLQSNVSTGTAPMTVNSTTVVTNLNADKIDGQDATTLVPTGTVLAYAANSAPSGWLECNGEAVSRTTYATLYSAIGTTFGTGDGSTTFNLPDLRGEFVRGWDHGKGTDSGRTFGSYQSHQVQDHNHNAPANSAYNMIGTTEEQGSGAWANQVNSVSTPTGTMASGNYGTETRPRNYALMYIIKY